MTIESLLSAALEPHRRTTLTAIITAVIAAVASVLLLGISGWFITGAALAGASGIIAVQAFNYLLPSAAIRGLAIARTAARYGERLASHRAALLAMASLRTSLFARLIGSRAPAALAMGAGDAAARLVQDVDTLEDLIVRKPARPVAAAAVVVALALALLAGWLVVLLLALLFALVPWLARRLGPQWLDAPAARVQAETAALKQDFIDYAAAAAELHAYDLGKDVAALLNGHASGIDAARRDLARGEALLAALLALASGVAIALTLALSTAELPFTIMAALAAGAAVEALAADVRDLSRRTVVTAAKARLSALLLPAPAPGPVLAGTAIMLPDGDTELALVSGDRLAIAGPSGSGKTRLIEALAGYRPAAGLNIRIDGQPIAALGADQLRPLFALSPQNASMIAGTLADNLRLARPGVSTADMWAALATACLDDEVRAMADGLDQWIGDGGARLSGGQRKRLSLTRALLARRPWLLLDEPSEGLDAVTEARLVTRLAQWLDSSNGGLIVVSHRPALWALAPRKLELQYASETGSRAA